MVITVIILQVYVLNVFKIVYYVLVLLLVLNVLLAMCLFRLHVVVRIKDLLILVL
jgi:hypothetical protein